MSETTASETYEFWYHPDNEHILQIFSYELMRSIGIRPKETLILLQLLQEHQVEIEKAAQKQEAGEAQSKQPLSIQERINRLFE